MSDPLESGILNLKINYVSLKDFLFREIISLVTRKFTGFFLDYCYEIKQEIISYLKKKFYPIFDNLFKNIRDYHISEAVVIFLIEVYYILVPNKIT